VGAYPSTRIELSNNVGIIEWRLYNEEDGYYWHSSEGIYFVGFDQDAGVPIYSDSEGGSPKSFGQLLDNGPKSGNWTDIRDGIVTNLTIVQQTNCSSYILLDA
jgi:hypothetical protein